MLLLQQERTAQEEGQTFPSSTLQPSLCRPLVRLLGEPAVKLEDTWHTFISDRRYQVLAYLAHAGSWVSRDKLAGLFYADTNQSAARSNLRKILFKVRAFDWLDIEQNDEALRWQTETDVSEFLTAIETQDWERAVKSYRGSFLQGFSESECDFDSWLETERVRLEDLYQHATENYAEVLEQHGDLASALRVLQALLERDPLLENIHRRVIALEWQRGNTEAAFEQFERCREVLQQELGVEPEHETLELLRKLEQGTSSAKFALLLKNPEAVADAPQTLFGREKLMEEIVTLLHQGERVLAQGFGGMGKTALAATVAKTFLNDSKRPVLWLQVGADDPEVILGALARPFEAQQDLAKAENKTAFLAEVFKKHQLSLVVLDDVWNAYSLSKVIEALPQGLPLLVTSRQRYSRIKRIYVDRLERKAALELLNHYATNLPPADLEREQGSRREREINSLCELLGDHPFTLRIAGLNLREGATVTDLLERIKSAPHDLKIPNDFKEAGRESVASLLSASLAPLSDLEYEVFMTYGILASPVATPGLLAQCANRELNKVEEALFNLVSRGLAERVCKPGSDLVSFRLHDLAHSYACTNRVQRPSTLIRAALAHLREHKDDVTLLELDIANLLSAAERCQEQGREDELLAIMYLLTVEGTYYTARGHGPKSVALLKKVAEIAERKGRLEEAHYCNIRLGSYHYNTFPYDYALAAGAYSHARDLAVQVNNQVREAVALGLVAISKTRQGEPSDDVADEAYKIAKATGDDECLAQVLGQLGYIALFKTDWKRANSYLKESLEVLERFTPNAASTSSVENERFFTLLNLAETEYRLGDFAKGKLIFEQASDLAKKLSNEIWLGYTYYGLAEMYHHANQRDLAKQHMLEALHLYQNNNGMKHVEEVLSFLKAGNYSVEEAFSLQR